MSTRVIVNPIKVIVNPKKVIVRGWNPRQPWLCGRLKGLKSYSRAVAQFVPLRTALRAHGKTKPQKLDNQPHAIGCAAASPLRQSWQGCPLGIPAFAGTRIALAAMLDLRNSALQGRGWGCRSGLKYFFKKYTHAVAVAFDVRGWLWNFFKIGASAARQGVAKRRKGPLWSSWGNGVIVIPACP
jgi:hypothetical protein